MISPAWRAAILRKNIRPIGETRTVYCQYTFVYTILFTYVNFFMGLFCLYQYDDILYCGIRYTDILCHNNYSNDKEW